MNHYFLGVDIGMTKSHALVADEHGRAVGFGQAGPGNWEGVGWEGTRRVLDEIIGQALAAAGVGRDQVAAAGFGLAGYDWPEDGPPHLELIRSLGINGAVAIANDALVGLVAGATEGWGVGVSAGTSCNCYGRNEAGVIGRVTGSSSWFAEFAGAGEVVTRAIQAVSLSWTRRGPATQLSQAFVALTGASDVTDLLAGMVRGRYRLSAGNATTVFAVAADGDEVAQEIIRWAGRELGSLAVGVIRQLGLEALSFEVVLSGSLFKGRPSPMEAMEQTIHAVAPGARLVFLQTYPVVGGVLLGMEQLNLNTTIIRPILAASTNKLLERVGG
ncbi:MAG: ATPase [Chloroflexi bacterium]|nr:ATPase [Chloroflexota bacterium]MCI0581234.1 ATPase [Chloroflexota bacterium]MCI0646911.1 ATPase [Chloroflexota bacterium]MCI0731640.1 ATPase [Chloroflexota bacterium]